MCPAAAWWACPREEDSIEIPVLPLAAAVPPGRGKAANWRYQSDDEHVGHVTSEELLEPLQFRGQQALESTPTLRVDLEKDDGHRSPPRKIRESPD